MDVGVGQVSTPGVVGGESACKTWRLRVGPSVHRDADCSSKVLFFAIFALCAHQARVYSIKK